MVKKKSFTEGINYGRILFIIEGRLGDPPST
jgi:hypothetical protein